MATPNVLHYSRNKVGFLLAITNNKGINYLFLQTKMQGTIKKLTDKNFGFISSEDGGNDFFFHANELNGVQFDELREGDNVTFDVSDTPKGKAAVNVSKA